MGFLASLSGILLEYDTLKVVHIKSKKVGIINRLIQLVIIAYIIGYVIVYKKGYQEFEPVDGAVTAKLKGASFPLHRGELYSRVWDASDYHIPPQQTNGFFVMTNMIVTPDQVNSTCPASYKNKPCTTDTNCTKDEIVPAGNGLMTGRCIPLNSGVGDAEFDDKSWDGNVTVKKSCEIISWCPLEKDVTPVPALLGDDAQNFTVLLKNSIIFRKFGVKRRNIPSDSTVEWLKTCRYNPNHSVDKYCPIIKLYDLFSYAGISDQWDTATTNGGVVSISITWNCNLDHGPENCNPEYGFSRLDDPTVALSPGFNFRYSQYHGTASFGISRTLIKAYGILFVININGEAGKFSVVPLMVNLASGLALLGVATLMCDFVVIHFLKQREFYKEKKYEDVEVDDELPSMAGLLHQSEASPLVQKPH